MKSNEPCILLVGNPNAGKSALFEALTGQKSKVANHSGVTVEKRCANVLNTGLNSVRVADLPGLYSLKAYSDEEKITIDALRDADRVVFVLDATQLKRNLYLLLELIDAGYQPLIALTQIDQAKKLGVSVDSRRLAKQITASTGVACEVFSISTKTGQGVPKFKSALEDLKSEELKPKELKPKGGSISEEDRYQIVDIILEGVLERRARIQFNPDQILMHPVVGLMALFAIFGSLFLLLFSVGKPMADFLERQFKVLGELTRVSTSPYPIFSSLLADGIIAGVGTLIAFLPLIALLSFLLGILEESGYLARATFLLDRVMSKAGLSGRAFVPALSGFACAIPALLSTRVIRSKQNRLIAMLVIPFLTCSARLPLYVLLIAAFFPSWQGALVIMSMYALGISAALLSGFWLKKFYFKTQTDELILELPHYRFPDIRRLFASVTRQVKSFLKQAGTLILSMSVLMWALFHFPQGVSIEETFAGQFGQLIEPLIAPLGFDWKLGIGLLAAFSAREVMVSTLGVIYSGNTDWALQYSPLVALSLLVFFALAMQCLSTSVVLKNETGSWKWPFYQFIGMTGLAWICSFAVFQIGSALGY